MVDVLVFDMDDTLFLEEEYVFSGFEVVSCWIKQNYGIGGFGKFAKAIYQAGNRTIVFNEALSKMGIAFDTQLIQKLVDIYRNHTPKINLFSDASWALEHFSDQVTLGLISDGYLNAQKNKFMALGIGHYFRKVIFTDELGRDCWKPSQVPYRKIEEALPAKSNGYAYVGDNPLKDFIAARKRNWYTIRITRNSCLYKGREFNPSNDADVVIESLYQLPIVLNKRDLS